MQSVSKLPSFSLHATNGDIRNSDELLGKTASVVIFTCNHCPYARAYVSRIARLVDKYEKNNILFYAISSNDVVSYPMDSFENMIDMGKLMHLHGKYLYDETQEVAKAFGAQRTPEAYVFDKEGILLYHGAIDDNWEKANEVNHHYLEDALNAAINGSSISITETPAVGCTIKWKPEA